MEQNKKFPPLENAVEEHDLIEDITWTTKNNLEEDHIVQDPQKCAKCLKCLQPCMTEYNPIPQDAGLCTKIKYQFLCPPHGYVAMTLTSAMLMTLLWGVCWAVFQNDALPGGNIFSLIILFIFCNIGGYVCTKIRLPPLLGMLIVGCVLKNVPKINVAENIDNNWSKTIRSVALVIILLRAGLGLDVRKLRKQLFPVLRLAVAPMIVEAVSVAVAAHYLFVFPWTWSFLLGFVHSAVSPAVVILSMLSLQELGLGTDQGIPSLLIAAGSLENVIAISAFSLTLGINFSHGSLVFNILRCPMEITIGFSYGILLGLVLWFIPKKSHKQLLFYRFILLFAGGLFSLFGFRAAGVSGAGALGCLILAFVAGQGWQRNKENTNNIRVTGVFAKLWVVFHPLLFGLVGAQINVSNIKQETIGLGTGIVLIGLVCRLSLAFLLMFRTGYNHKEKLFITLAWLPKATVQAAIGSIALDTAREKNTGQEDIERGLQILTMAVYLIVLTAPLGALLIPVTAPKLLQAASTETAIGSQEEISLTQRESSFTCKT